jgi:hypothetical protein
VDRFTVRQQDNPKVAIFHLRHLAPAPNTPICLNYLANWSPNGPGNPLFSYRSAIGALPDGLKVMSYLHATKVTECGRWSICCLTLALSGRAMSAAARRRCMMAYRASGAHAMTLHGPLERVVRCSSHTLSR